jgi:tetratricopeptide (TPR) repeat protein
MPETAAFMHSGEGRREALARHLLRHLDDARALRDNPLVASLFQRTPPIDDPLAVIRRIVARVAEELRERAADGHSPLHAERQYQILVRADLGGELHKRVSADLGISPRLFYSERRAIRLFVAQAVSRYVRVEMERHSVVLDPFEMGFNRARALYEMGAVRAAIGQLESMLHASSETSRRVRLWSALVARLAQNGRTDEARAVFAAAHQEFESGFAAHVAVTESMLLWNEGREFQALTCNERVFPTLDDLARSGDHGSRDFALEAYLVAQLPLAWLENLPSVRAVLERARSIVRQEEPASLLRLMFLSAQGSLLMHENGGTDNVRGIFSQAAHLAQKEGLQEHYVMTMLLMSLLEERSGDPARALLSVRDLLAFVDGIGSVTVQRKALIRAAALEVHYGDAKRGIEYAKQVSGGDHLVRFYGAQATWLEGEGYLRLGRNERARRTFDHLCDQASPAIFHGKALMSLAKLDAQDGREGDARERLDAGLRLIESSGMLGSLGLGYRAAAKITGDPKYLRRALELIGDEFKGAS